MPTTYSSPGNADQLTNEVLEHWNAAIAKAYSEQSSLHSRFFAIDPASIPAAEGPVPKGWFGDPAEPAFCIDEAVAQQLSDWGVRGRHVLHNEYCEYRSHFVSDLSGRQRLKRVEVTTELREYWVTLAVHSPASLQVAASDVLGRPVAFQELYGVQNPEALSSQERLRSFCRTAAGHGNDPQLAAEGIPAQPTGRINTEELLFMTHPINGLDDLIYIILFGAQPYITIVNGVREPASRDSIFSAFDVKQLACRHADPAAAVAAHQAAMQGRTVALFDPLGVYIQAFTESDFLLDGQPLPQNWINYSRGKQRLVVGPLDSENRYLDEAVVVEGAQTVNVRGGYDIVKRVEVGPNLAVGAQSAVQEDEFVEVPIADSVICREASVCSVVIGPLKAEYDAAHNAIAFARIAPRQLGV